MRSVVAALVLVVCAGCSLAVGGDGYSDGPFHGNHNSGVIYLEPVGTKIGFAMPTLANASGDDDITVLGVSLIQGGPGLEQLGDPVLYPPGRPNGLWTLVLPPERAWPPPNAPDPLLAIEGLVLPAGSEDTYAVEFPVEVVHEGRSSIVGYEVRYRAGGREYRERFLASLTNCTPPTELEDCENEYGWMEE